MILPCDGGHASDGGLAEEPLILLKLPVPLVCPYAGLSGCQVAVPTPDDIPEKEKDHEGTQTGW